MIPIKKILLDIFNQPLLIYENQAKSNTNEYNFSHFLIFRCPLRLNLFHFHLNYDLHFFTDCSFQNSSHN